MPSIAGWARNKFRWPFSCTVFNSSTNGGRVPLQQKSSPKTFDGFSNISIFLTEWFDPVQWGPCGNCHYISLAGACWSAKSDKIRTLFIEMSLYGLGLFVLSSSPAGGQLSPTVWTLVVIGSATTVIVDRKVERSSFVDCVLKVFATGRLQVSWPV